MDDAGCTPRCGSPGVDGLRFVTRQPGRELAAEGFVGPVDELVLVPAGPVLDHGGQVIGAELEQLRLYV